MSETYSEPCQTSKMELCILSYVRDVFRTSKMELFAKKVFQTLTIFTKSSTLDFSEYNWTRSHNHLVRKRTLCLNG